MIVTSTKFQLLIVIPDPSSDRGRLVEIERCARNGSQLPVWNQALVDGVNLLALIISSCPRMSLAPASFRLK
jgi:hypothetical protein